MYKPQNLKRWEYPDSYIGAEWYDFFSAGVGQSRDSEALESANFQAMQNILDAIPEPKGWDHDASPWQVVSENHWAVGWVEWIAIHQDAEAHLRAADETKGKLDDYPIIDEELYSEIENENCRLTWEGCFSPKERVQYLRKHSYTGSFMSLLAACRGSWYHAASALHCPSDLLN